MSSMKSLRSHRFWRAHPLLGYGTQLPSSSPCPSLLAIPCFKTLSGPSEAGSPCPASGVSQNANSRKGRRSRKAVTSPLVLEAPVLALQEAEFCNVGEKDKLGIRVSLVGTSQTWLYLNQAGQGDVSTLFLIHPLPTHYATWPKLSHFLQIQEKWLLLT